MTELVPTLLLCIKFFHTSKTKKCMQRNMQLLKKIHNNK